MKENQFHNNKIEKYLNNYDESLYINYINDYC